MKKFISVALVASMVASMGVTAFADTQYEFKDKMLEFDKELLYDGKGADELWLPIVAKKDGQTYYITDGTKDGADLATEFTDLAKDANYDYQLGKFILGVTDDMTPLKITIPTGKDGKTDLKATFEEYTTATGGQVVTEVPTGDTIGLFSAAGYTGSEADKMAYIETIVKQYKDAGLPMKEISKVDSQGRQLTADGYRYEVIKTLFGSPNSPLAQLGISGKNYGQVAAKVAKTVDIDEIEDVNEVEIEWKANRGGNLVADVYIDEVDDLGGLTCVVFELTDHLGIAVQYITGELRMENGKNRELDEQDIRYNYYGKAAYSVTEYQFTVGDLENGYEVDGYDNYINLVDFNDEYHYVFFKKNVEWVEMEDNQGFYFEVDVAEQGKINLVYNNKPIDAVSNIATEDALLTFYNFEARPIFDFAGKVTITPPDEYEDYDIESLHLYTYERDGSLKKVKQAKVGEDGDTLEFRTNTLSKYVLSTEELTLLSDAERAALEALKEAEANGETVVEDAAVVVEDTKANPSTGC